MEGFSLLLKHFEKCEISIPDNFHFELYRYFQYSDNLKKMRILFEQSKIDMNAKDNNGRTLLQIAISNYDTNIEELYHKIEQTALCTQSKLAKQ